MTRQEIEKLWNVKLERRYFTWEGYTVYVIDPEVPPGAVIGWPQFIVEKDGCTLEISGHTTFGGIFMDRLCNKSKKAQKGKEISPNRAKKVSTRDLDFCVIGMLGQELFVIEDYKTSSKNPAIGFILDQVPLVCQGPQDGFPELFVLHELKKIGAKHIRYTMPKYPPDAIF